MKLLDKSLKQGWNDRRGMLASVLTSIAMKFEQAMLMWLHDNPQGKLERETIGMNNEEYNNMFFSKTGS